MATETTEEPPMPSKRTTVPIGDRLSYTIAETAELLGVSYTTVAQLVASGELRSMDLASEGATKARKVVPKNVLDQFIADRTKGAA